MGSDPEVKSSLKLPSIPPKTALRDTPVEYRILLRLVTLHEQQKLRTTVKELSEATLIKPGKVVEALTGIFKEKWATIKLIHSPVDFEFTVPEEVLAATRSAAATYRQHLEAVVRRIAKAKEQQAKILPAFKAKDREPFMEEATVLTAKLNHTDKAVIEKVANCMARLGPEEIRLLVDRALVEHGEHSPRSCFFKLYTDRRAVVLYNNAG